MLPVRLFIDAVLRLATDDGVAVYVVHSGDADRGNVFVKTMGKDTIFYIHHRTYDFISNTYTWQGTEYADEISADTALHTHHHQDTDCWCIDIQGQKNYFVDIMIGV